MKLVQSLPIIACCVAIYGCQSNTPVHVSKVPVKKPIIIQTAPPIIAQQLLPPRSPSHNPLNQAPSFEYQTWLSQNNHLQQVTAYKAYLAQQQIYLPVPDEEFFRSARAWQQCGSEEFSAPTPELWDHMRPTLALLNSLLQQHIISDIELTSTFRPSSLNECAGGAKSSSHLNNNALDFRIGPVTPSAVDTQFVVQNKQQLCKFWQQKGKDLNMGLGVYSTGQIHIDTQGFRTWGVDHTWHSSPCAEIIP